jgi:hypothetical protein
MVQTPAAGGPYTITFNGQNTVVLDNILIGEVWICSGQSNMEMMSNGVYQMSKLNCQPVPIKYTFLLYSQDNFINTAG